MDKSKSINTLAFDLLNFYSKKESENIFFSPLSIFSCMNLALLGAKNETEKNLFNGLRCDKSFENVNQVFDFMKDVINDYAKSNETGSFTSLVNRVLLKKDNDSVSQNYHNKAKEFFNAQVDEVDFVKDKKTVVKSVNDWVKENTNKMIPSIISENEITNLTVAILLNAVYFNGKWKTVFKPDSTNSDTFYNYGDKQKAKTIQMMHNHVEVEIGDLELNGEKSQFVSIPYTGNYKLNIILPNSIDGYKQFNDINYENIKSHLKTRFNDIELWLPKLKFETSYNLNESLMHLGIKDAFNDNADFGGIKSGKIKISKVIHKAAIEMDEQGTRAAAVTSVAFMCTSMPMKKTKVKIDHPFIFYIEDTSRKIILFAGQVVAL